MGRSVIAYLGFGVDCTEEAVDTLPWDSFHDGEDDEEREPKLNFEDWLAKISGVEDPSRELEDQDESWSVWYAVPENEQAMKEYWDKQRQLLADCPIAEAVYYYEEPGLLVVVNGTLSRASWAEPAEPTTSVDETKVEAAKAFCAEHGIAFEDPKWILVAYSDN